MEPLGRALGPADTRFNNFIGTDATDDAEAVRDRPSPEAASLVRCQQDDHRSAGCRDPGWIWNRRVRRKVGVEHRSCSPEVGA